MDASKIKDLKFFVDQCKANPAILNDPSISFFRQYLESLGCKIPGSAHKYGGSADSHHANHGVYDSDEDVEDKENDFKMKSESEDELIESDLELEGETVEPDNDPPQKMGDRSIEVTDENREAAQIAKGNAMEAISEGKLDEAVDQLTNAILLNPSAIMYSSRASVFIKMKKPNSAIRDATAALEINPDSAKGYKSRGIALAMLGDWEAAAKDLHVASKLDYDEEIMAVLKKVEPNAHKIEEHNRKYDRLKKERTNKKMERERQRRRAEAQAAYNKAKKKETRSSNPCGGCTPGGGCSEEGKQGGFPGGMPAGMGGGGDNEEEKMEKSKKIMEEMVKTRAFLPIFLLLTLLLAAASANIGNIANIANMRQGGRSLMNSNIDCGRECDRRCALSSRQKMCLRACGTCCSRCNCVPPGTYGNRDVCPCYANMKTHGNRLKCP